MAEIIDKVIKTGIIDAFHKLKKVEENMNVLRKDVEGKKKEDSNQIPCGKNIYSS